MNYLNFNKKHQNLKVYSLTQKFIYKKNFRSKFTEKRKNC